MFSQAVDSVSRKACRLGLWVFPGLVGLAGCIAAHFTPTATFARPAKTHSQVEVIRSGGPGHAFQAVGTIQVRSGLGYRMGLDKVIDEAAARGCDAIYNLQNAAAYDRSTIGDTGEKTREDDFTATCAIYDLPDAGPGAAPAVEVSPPTEAAPPFRAGTPD